MLPLKFNNYIVARLFVSKVLVLVAPILAIRTEPLARLATMESVNVDTIHTPHLPDTPHVFQEGCVLKDCAKVSLINPKYQSRLIGQLYCNATVSVSIIMSPYLYKKVLAQTLIMAQQTLVLVIVKITYITNMIAVNMTIMTLQHDRCAVPVEGALQELKMMYELPNLLRLYVLIAFYKGRCIEKIFWQ